MGQTTGIAWTDHTFNPWRGCTKVAPECAKCYAEKLSGRNPKTLGTWGPNGTRVVAAESYWNEPVKWNKQAEADGVRRRVFCASLADVFEDWDGPIVDTQGRELFFPDRPGHPNLDNDEVGAFASVMLDDVRGRLFNLIDSTPWLDWLLLTKRPENILPMWLPRHRPNCERCGGDGCDPELWVAGRHPMQMDPDPCRDCMHRPNVWLGTSAGTQESADRFIPKLMECRDLADVLFVSCEPMLEAIDFRHFHWGDLEDGPAIDWLIVGCESNGSKVGRLGEFPNESAWRSHAIKLMGQCREAGVPFFLKQWPDEGRVNHDPRSYPQQFPLTEGAISDPTQ